MTNREELNSARGVEVFRAFSDVYAGPERKRGCLFRLIGRKRAPVSGTWKQMACLDSAVCFVGVNC